MWNVWVDWRRWGRGGEEGAMLIGLPPKARTRPLPTPARDSGHRTRPARAPSQLAQRTPTHLVARHRPQIQGITPTDAPALLKRPTLTPRPQKRGGLRHRVGAKGRSPPYM